MWTDLQWWVNFPQGGVRRGNEHALTWVDIDVGKQSVLSASAQSVGQSVHGSCQFLICLYFLYLPVAQLLSCYNNEQTYIVTILMRVLRIYNFIRSVQKYSKVWRKEVWNFDISPQNLFVLCEHFFLFTIKKNGNKLNDWADKFSDVPLSFNNKDLIIRIGSIWILRMIQYSINSRKSFVNFH